MSAVNVMGLVIVKRFTYRGDNEEEWSNKYWLSGPVPTTSQQWQVEADALIAIERACYSSASVVTAAYGYAQYETDPNADVIPSVWSHDYTGVAELPGLLAEPGGHPFAGDQAGWVSWKTDRKSVKGKYIYCRKFFHDGFLDPTARDNISVNTLTAYNNFAAELGATPTIPGLGHVRSPRADAPILAAGAPIYVTTRTLKRRGKRPLAH